jgi:hypothetical protein
MIHFMLLMKVSILLINKLNRVIRGGYYSMNRILNPEI